MKEGYLSRLVKCTIFLQLRNRFNMSTNTATFFSESSKKGEVSELKKSLQSAEVQRDASLYRKVIQKVVSCMTLGMDLSSLFMDMIKVKLVKKSKSTFYSDSYFTASFSKDIAFTSLSWPNPSVIFNFIQKLMQVWYSCSNTAHAVEPPLFVCGWHHNDRLQEVSDSRYSTVIKSDVSITQLAATVQETSRCFFPKAMAGSLLEEECRPDSRVSGGNHAYTLLQESLFIWMLTPRVSKSRLFLTGAGGRSCACRAGTQLVS